MVSILEVAAAAIVTAVELSLLLPLLAVEVLVLVLVPVLESLPLEGLKKDKRLERFRNLISKREQTLL